MWLLATLMACTGGAIVDDTSDVDTDDTGDVDTEDTAPPTVDDVLAALPDCVPASSDGDLDLATGCAGDVCVGMYASDVQAALGEGNCDATTGYPGYVSCWWEQGITITFRDADLDGELNADARNEGMYVYAPYAGGTADGLGPGASMSCFVDALGTPDQVSFSSGADGFAPDSMWWLAWGFGAFDQYTPNAYGQDGVSDYLYVSGAPDGPPP